jgi:hypothetical protein
MLPKNKKQNSGMCVCVCVLMKMWTGMYQVQNLAKVIMCYNFLLT